MKSVAVNNDAEIIKLVLMSKHHSFPNLTFFDFTVTEDRINIDILAEELCALQSQEDAALWTVAAIGGNHRVRLVNLIEF